MYLKQLDIFGFKSFPHKTTLKFEPGITVVVGPNGCGKSNILDSIKWALGEQSPKSLRGSKMEDVIFNGTENHPSLNFTEVSLTFSNEDNYLPLEYKEVCITRRLYRSGESQYFINKNPVRLKDIQALFMGTGIGESTYSFVEQGKIEIFLQFKPEEKRLIFDEASGIIKYKEKKKETLRRLEEAENNLLRLDDIISEVQRQLRYLDRQVEKAKKFKELEQRLIEVEKIIAGLEINKYQKDINKLLDEINSLKDNEEKKTKKLKEAKSYHSEKETELRYCRESCEENRREVISLKAKIENYKSHINLLHQRINELEIRNSTIEESKNTFQERLSLQEKRIVTEKSNLATFEERIKDVSDCLKKLKDRKEHLKKTREEAKERIKKERGKLLSLESERVNCHNSLIELQTNLSSFTKRKQRLLLDSARLDELLKDKQEAYLNLKEENKKILGRIEEIKNNLETLIKHKSEIEVKIENLKNEQFNREKELAELNSCYEFLKKLHITKKVTVILEEEPRGFDKLLISLENVNFNQKGNCYSASLEAKAVSLRESDLRERIESTQKEITRLRDNLSSLEIEKNKISKEIAQEKRKVADEENSYRDRAQKEQNLFQELERFKEESELLDGEKKEALDEIAKLEKNKKEEEERLKDCQDSITQCERTLKEHKQIILNSSEEEKEIDIQIAKKEEESQFILKEKESLLSKISILEDERINLESNLKGLDKELIDNKKKIEDINKEIEKLSIDIDESGKKLEEKSKVIEELDKKNSLLEEVVLKEKEKIKKIEEEIQKISSSLYSKKLEIQSLEYEKGKIRDYLKQVYRIDFDIPTLEEIPQDIETFYKDREELKRKKESLGEVNLVAIDEFEELKEREQFLQKQKDDLITSKDNLKKAIQKINKTSRELFLETFNKIEAEFKKIFRFLFGGGRAQLILLDKENVLESGIEIEVQPPGKKLQNVSLLSGGEKALTAISLIFAIFKVNPSPICVLDEIDAPLDEANVDRFNHLLKEFAATSQFLLITHNKKTMSSADCLYGVTMEERGVSKLVSVKFASQQEVATS